MGGVFVFILANNTGNKRVISAPRVETIMILHERFFTEAALLFLGDSTRSGNPTHSFGAGHDGRWMTFGHIVNSFNRQYGGGTSLSGSIEIGGFRIQ